jgi:uncharacterized protein (TIGR02246 family)
MAPRKVMSWTVVFLVATACSPGVDTAREAQQLLEIDRAWAQIAATGNMPDSVLSFWAEDARVVLAGEPVFQGKAAIREMLTDMASVPGFHVTWTPEGAEVSVAGDFAYTFGSNEFTAPDSTGELMTTKGRYITVWRKEADGRWRCVMDYTNPAPAEGPTQ